jgi:hypothetical protein
VLPCESSRAQIKRGEFRRHCAALSAHRIHKRAHSGEFLCDPLGKALGVFEIPGEVPSRLWERRKLLR